MATGRRLLLALAWVLIAGCEAVPENPAPPMAPRDEAPALYAPPVVQDYRVQIGDSLALRSYFDAQLNQDALVRPDGRISALLIGDMVVAGLTPQQLATQLRDRYRDLIGATDVTVSVTRSVGLSVYLSGEIRLPSVLPIDGNLTLMQSLARAGGMLTSAHAESVLLIRNRDDGGLSVNKVDVERILRGEAPDPYLQPRDVVFVPRSPIAQVGLYVEQYINAIIPKAVQLQLGWYSTRVTNTNPVLQVSP